MTHFEAEALYWGALNPCPGPRPQPASGVGDVDKLRQAVDLLRFCRCRLTVMRLRVHGASPVFGGLLVARALGTAGYASQLRGGDSLFLRVGDDFPQREATVDAEAEKAVIGSLSRTLAELTQNGPRVHVLISIVHVWSDAVGSADELVELVSRLAPKADIAAPTRDLERHDQKPSIKTEICAAAI